MKNNPLYLQILATSDFKLATKLVNRCVMHPYYRILPYVPAKLGFTTYFKHCVRTWNLNLDGRSKFKKKKYYSILSASSQIAEPEYIHSSIYSR